MNLSVQISISIDNSIYKGKLFPIKSLLRNLSPIDETTLRARLTLTLFSTLKKGSALYWVFFSKRIAWSRAPMFKPLWSKVSDFSVFPLFSESRSATRVICFVGVVYLVFPYTFPSAGRLLSQRQLYFMFSLLQVPRHCHSLSQCR